LTFYNKGMHLQNPEAPQRNQLAEFVVQDIPTYEYLNAPTLEESNARFQAAVVTALNAHHIEAKIGDGAFYTVHPLAEDDRVVVKQLRPRLRDRTGSEQVWQKIQDDHRTIVTYVGNKFVPSTAFVVLDSPQGFSITTPAQEAGGQAYIALQERALGTKFDQLPEGFQPSPALKQDALEYIVRYERMMRDGFIMDHPDDLMINDTPDAARTITLLDTNHLGTFWSMVESRNSVSLLVEYGIDPASIRTPGDVIDLLRDITPHILQLDAPAARELREQDYPTLMGRIRAVKGSLAAPLHEALRRIPDNPQSIPPELRGNRFLEELLPSGFFLLVSAVDRCAPPGQHPHQLKMIMRAFGINKADALGLHA
jgi:hypothetical protein